MLAPTAQRIAAVTMTMRHATGSFFKKYTNFVFKNSSGHRIILTITPTMTISELKPVNTVCVVLGSI